MQDDRESEITRSFDSHHRTRSHIPVSQEKYIRDAVLLWRGLKLARKASSWREASVDSSCVAESLRSCGPSGS